MSKYAITGWIALCSGALMAQAGAAQAQSCPVPVIAAKMELRPVPGSDLVTVPVEINGKPKQFLLTISNNPTEVSQATVSELSLPQVDQSSNSNAMNDLNTPLKFGASFYDVKGAGSAVNYQTRVRIASFTIGGATVHDLQFLVANDRDMGKAEPYDGLLTGSDFPQYDVEFDFGKKQLNFLDATSCTDLKGVTYWAHSEVAVVPMTLENGKMVVPVTIQGHALNAVIDTGLAQTVMRRDVAEGMLGLKTDAPDMTADGSDGAGQTVYRHTFPQIAFGGVFASNVPARIQANSMVHKINRTPVLGSRAQFTADPSERIPDLALGMDVLHQLHIYAAFNENRLYVTSAE